MKRTTETEPPMKKNIAAIIAATNAFLAIGTCGALECDTISLGSAFIRCLVFSVIVFASLGLRLGQIAPEHTHRTMRF